jgi:hypothetical protein
MSGSAREPSCFELFEDLSVPVFVLRDFFLAGFAEGSPASTTTRPARTANNAKMGRIKLDAMEQSMQSVAPVENSSARIN